jgi:hypothetical protein
MDFMAWKGLLLTISETSLVESSLHVQKIFDLIPFWGPNELRSSTELNERKSESGWAFHDGQNWTNVLVCYKTNRMMSLAILYYIFLHSQNPLSQQDMFHLWAELENTRTQLSISVKPMHKSSLESPSRIPRD